MGLEEVFMVLVTSGKDEVSQKALDFMTTKDYKLISQTESSITFENGRNCSTGILIILIIFLLIGAIIYYFLAKKHTITVTFIEAAGGTNVECSTNTTESLKDSQDFLRALPKP